MSAEVLAFAAARSLSWQWEFARRVPAETARSHILTEAPKEHNVVGHYSASSAQAFA